ncbi:MAG: VWA domain-containing protein [Deltaproteobacteria bacterium]|nr:VWA domain-containing protein [Deltaproteobacteria bacterium]
MGFGAYSHAAHVALTRARPPEARLFRASRADPLLDPRDALRESRDSEDHPDSLPVVFALDVTGSMGQVPRRLATATLPDFMAVLLGAGVRDPQLCFMGVGHAGHDAAPLQVGQFESTAALIDQWLTRLWIEGGGVGQHESYELAMHFAAHRMTLDSVRLRGRRGFFFLVGDVLPNPALSRREVARLLGEAPERDLPIREVIEDLQRHFEPFFLMAPGTERRIGRAWRDLLGDRVIALEHVDDTAYVAAGLVALLEGAAPSLSAYVARLGALGLERRRAARVARSLVPLAASLGRDGAPDPTQRGADLPVGDPPSGLIRPGSR